MVGHQAGRGRSEGEGLNRDDTIVAIATPPGRGGVGIVRISGPDAHRTARALIGHRTLRERVPTLVRLHDADGQPVDEGLAISFPRPRSFTGEDVVELHGHGSPVVLDMLVESALAAGARLAEPGEFSLRAFLNGKLDLAQAEAIADLIDAGSRSAARAAAGSLAGVLSADINRIKDSLIELRVIIEASIDFPDEDLDLLSEYGLRERIAGLAQDVDALVTEASQAIALTRAPTVVIGGAPNAGKSSLLNRLTGRDSAIVTHVPGTTRDVLRERIELGGVQLELVDTAGLRDTDDIVEAEGVRRARHELGQADLLLFVIDGSSDATRDADALRRTHDIETLLQDGHADRVLFVINKVDRTGETARALPDVAMVSAMTGDGMDALRGILRERLALSDATPRFLARRRHLDALQRCSAALALASAQLATTPRFELAAEELRLAQSHLGEIVGDLTSDELLGHIFGSFCIGK